MMVLERLFDCTKLEDVGPRKFFQGFEGVEVWRGWEATSSPRLAPYISFNLTSFIFDSVVSMSIHLFDAFRS